MADEKILPEDGEVTEEQLEDVAGGVISDINIKISTDGEATDDDHGTWIDIIEDDPPPKKN